MTLRINALRITPSEVARVDAASEALDQRTAAPRPLALVEDSFTVGKARLPSANDVPLDVAALTRGVEVPTLRANDLLRLQYTKPGPEEGDTFEPAPAPAPTGITVGDGLQNACGAPDMEDADTDDDVGDDFGDGGGGGGGDIEVGEGDGGGGIGPGGDDGPIDTGGDGPIDLGGDGGGELGVGGDDGVDQGEGADGDQTESSAIDQDAASAFLDKNAEPKSTGKCATYVREALEAGGLDTEGHPLYAKDYGDFLESKGYDEVDLDGYTPEKGDIVVLQPVDGKTNEAGHIAMFDDKQWVSDFKQRDLYGGPGYRDNHAPYKIYRP